MARPPLRMRYGPFGDRPPIVLEVIEGEETLAGLTSEESKEFGFQLAGAAWAHLDHEAEDDEPGTVRVDLRDDADLA